jgi:hypothetical protein
MATIVPMERIYERVNLVQGKGSRRRGRMCIMSFVALLAGERHTDAPTAASSFIRYFAVHLNDAMPRYERQRLKPFAPRIVGTNDGLDVERARLTLRVLTEEIAPQYLLQLAAERPSPWGGTKSPQEFVSTFVANGSPNFGGCDTARVAVAAAKLLTFCAIMAPGGTDCAWYWSKGIDLLDRLCDVGPANSRPSASLAQLEHAAAILNRPNGLDVITRIAGEVVRRIRRQIGDASMTSGPDDVHGQRGMVDSAASTLEAPVKPTNSTLPKRKSSVEV